MGKKFMGYDNASELITAIGNKIKAKYTKPSGGIPKSDLASAVQTSLGKADSALQSESDPTVPSWAKQSSKPSYTASEVGAAPENHTHYQLSTIGDYRTVDTKPNDYSKIVQFKGLKQNSVIGNPSTDTYSYLIGLRGWSDNSGGNAHEFAFNDSGIFVRRGASTTWDSWKKLSMTSDIPSSLPASDVYPWAKQSSKPSYTYSEVGAAASSHTHGNIQDGGTLQTNDITIASGDKIIVTDNSNSNKVARTSASFDGSTDTKALTKKGTFEDFVPPSSFVEIMDNGHKNLLDTRTSSTKKFDSLSFIQDDDGYVTASPSNSDGRTWTYAQSQYTADLAAGTYVFVIDVKTASTDSHVAGLRIYKSSGAEVYVSDSLSNRTGRILIEFTADSADTYGFMIKIWNGVWRFMLCTKSQYNLSDKYESYGLGNQILTPALTEVVDSGAKNLIDPNATLTYPYRGMTLTYSSDGVLVTGKATENPYSYVAVGSITITAGMTYVLYDPSYTSSNTAYFYVDSATAFGVVSPCISGEPQYLVAKNSGTFSIYMRVPYNVTVNKLYKPMVCTKAAFDISRKYALYTPTLYQVNDRKAPKLHGSAVTSGDLNNINESEFRIYTNNVSNLPESSAGFAYVRTSWYDANATLQEATMMMTGNTYVRVKWAGTWKPWKKVTND